MDSPQDFRVRKCSHRRVARLGVIAAIGLALVSSSLVWWYSGEAAAADGPDTKAVPPSLAIEGNFPDPDVSKFGDTYYAYSTNSAHNLPVATSASPSGPWNVQAEDGLPDLGAWAQAGRTWAPDVSSLAGGGYVLYYTAHSIDPDRQCIGVATSDSPAGPFEPRGDGPLVCPAEQGGAIDASTYVEGDKRYLIFKTDANAVGQPPEIFIQETTADGLGLVGEPTVILRNDQDAERGILEAPVLVKQGGHYVLFYAGGEYWNDSYFTSYATSDSLTGSYTKAYRPLLTGASLDSAVNGPGGADVVRGTDGNDHIFFHGHVGDGRAMYVAEMGWANDYPVVRGSRVRTEAEDGTLHNCEVRDNAAGASMGKVAAKIDHADSYVELKVFATRDGDHTIAIAFANGSGGEAQHALSVNGAEATAVTYPQTGWDNWQQVDVNVDLSAGFNTIRLNHKSAYAELDFVEVR